MRGLHNSVFRRIPKFSQEMHMKIEQNGVYFFIKSGNLVRAIAPADPYMRQTCWTVERILGASAGKRMTVPARALVKSLY